MPGPGSRPFQDSSLARIENACYKEYEERGPSSASRPETGNRPSARMAESICGNPSVVLHTVNVRRKNPQKQFGA